MPIASPHHIAAEVEPTDSPGARWPILLLDLLIVAALAVGLYTASQKGGVGADLLNDDGRVVVDRLFAKPERFKPLAPPALDKWPERLQLGDEIRTIGTTSIHTTTQLQLLLDGYRHGDIVPIGITRAGRDDSFDLLLVPYYTRSYLISIGVSGGIYFLLGLLVYLLRPLDRSALFFHAGMNCTAILIAATWGSGVVVPAVIGMGLHILYVAASVFLSLFFVHFALLFPRQLIAHGRRTRLLYLPGIFLCVITSAAMVGSYAESFEGTATTIFVVAHRAVEWFFAAGLLLGIGLILHSYVTTHDEVERRKLRWLMVGCIVGPVAYLLRSVPRLLDERPLLSEEMLILLSVLTPIFFTIAIVRHRLMDIDLILSRSAAYSLVLLFLGVLYICGVYVFAAVIGDLRIGDARLSTIVAAISVTLLFEPVRMRVQRVIDRRFFRVRYDYRRTQTELTEAIADSYEIDSIGSIIADRLDELLGVESVALLLVDPKLSTVRTVLHRRVPRARWKQAAITMAEDALEARCPIVAPRAIEPGARVADSERIERLGMALAIAEPLAAGKRALLLAVGPKRSHMRFTLEDIDLLETVMTQAAAAIDRIELQRSLLLTSEESSYLRELSELKSYFVSSVNHELKTPLTSIALFAEMLEKDPPPLKTREYGRIIAAETGRLTRLIDNVLDYAKIEHGMKEYRREEIDLGDVVHEVLGSMEYQIASAGFTLRIDDARIPLPIRADPDAVAQALVNLLSNGMKYSGSDHRLELRTFARDGMGGVAVRDHGVGIPADERKRIFAPFHRSDHDDVRRVTGAGLGLAIVQHIMDAHDGVIDVESELDEGGSIFSLLFPLDDHEPTPSLCSQSITTTTIHENDPAD